MAAANNKPVIMFGARHEGHESQAGSGYGAYVGGAVAVSTDEQGEWWGSKGLGTVPHALIAVYGGDTTVATLKFDEYINRATDGVGHLTAQGTPEGHVNVTALVDFRNDAVNTSLGVAHAFGQRLWGVRVDTSESLVDLSIVRELQEKEGVAGGSDVRGVTPRLVELLRAALDEAGYRHVRIVASGGFDAEKIGVRGARRAGPCGGGRARPRKRLRPHAESSEERQGPREDRSALTRVGSAPGGWKRW